jgi:hypothetical protein
MWRWVEVDALVRRPIEPVFAYLENPVRWPEFAPAVVMRRPLDPGPPVVGARWAAMDRIGPFRFRFTDELVAHEPPSRVVWDSSAPWNARVEYVCTPDVAGTRVHARYEGDLAGGLRALGAVPPALMGWILGRDFVRLERILPA